MRRNQSGQLMGLQVTALDGTPFTGPVTIYIQLDSAAQAVGAVGSGLMTHKGKGRHVYAPSAAETNGVLVAWTGEGSGAINAGAQLYTDGDISVIDYGAAQSAGAASLVLAAAASFADDELVGATLVILSASTGAKQSRQILSNVGSTDTVTVDAWATTPTGTIVYAIFATPPSSAISLPAVNIKMVDDELIQGSGTTDDKWRPV